MSSNVLAPILTTAINSTIENSVFPENVKVATVVPLDKGKPDKIDISNFRPDSLLNKYLWESDKWSISPKFGKWSLAHGICL